MHENCNLYFAISVLCDVVIAVLLVLNMRMNRENNKEIHFNNKRIKTLKDIISRRGDPVCKRNLDI